MHRGVVVSVGEEVVDDIDYFRDYAVKQRSISADNDNTQDTEAFKSKHRAALANFKTRLWKKNKVICPNSLSQQLLALIQNARQETGNTAGGDDAEGEDSDYASSDDAPMLSEKATSIFTRVAKILSIKTAAS